MSKKKSERAPPSVREQALGYVLKLTSFEYGGKTWYVKKATAGERDLFLKAINRDEFKASQEMLVALYLREPDGRHSFDASKEEDLAIIRDMDPDFTQEVVYQAMKAAGLTKEEIEQIEKK